MRPLLLVLLAGSLSSAALIAGIPPAAADRQSGPELWTPPALSTAGYESTPSFSPDGRELVYMAADPAFTRWRLQMVRCEGGRWTTPRPPAFAAPPPVIEADPGYTPDGAGLYFVSARHDPANEDLDIWYVARSAAGTWGMPERLPAPVNSPHAELLPRADRLGNLYFGSSRPGGHGRSDIYVATRDPAGAWRVRNVGPPVSTAANDYEAEISADGRTLILVADRGDRSHLYRFERAATGWREIGRVPADPNVFQVGPLLSPNARALLFAQAHPDRSGEIYRIDLTPGRAAGWPRPCAEGEHGG